MCSLRAMLWGDTQKERMLKNHRGMFFLIKLRSSHYCFTQHLPNKWIYFWGTLCPEVSIENQSTSGLNLQVAVLKFLLKEHVLTVCGQSRIRGSLLFCRSRPCRTSPSNKGQIFLQHMSPPWLVYWPSAVSRMNKGIPQDRRNRK